MNQGFIAWLELLEAQGGGIDGGAGRRQAPRFPFTAEVRLTGEAVEAEGITEEVSAGGVRVSVPAPLPLGAVCGLEVRSPTQRVFHNTARVVWSTKHGNAAIAGLAFI